MFLDEVNEIILFHTFMFVSIYYSLNFLADFSEHIFIPFDRLD